MTTKRTHLEIRGIEEEVVTYVGVDGILWRGEDVSEDHLPIGTVFRENTKLVRDIETMEGEMLPDQAIILCKRRTFFRGRVVEGNEARQLMLPPEVRALVAISGGTIKVLNLFQDIRVVAVMMHDGTEVGIVLRDGDVPPPKNSSLYAVGESPEELTSEEVDEVQCENAGR